jgi:predicted DNA-binding transcriptional regulator AlpA
MTIPEFDPALLDRAARLLGPTDPLLVALKAHVASGACLPEPVETFLRNDEIHPNEIIRRKDIGNYLGLAATAIDDVIKSGELGRPLLLREGGQATGWLGAEVLKYQLRMVLRNCLDPDQGGRKSTLLDKAQHMRARKALKAAS